MKGAPPDGKGRAGGDPEDFGPPPGHGGPFGYFFANCSCVFKTEAKKTQEQLAKK